MKLVLIFSVYVVSMFSCKNYIKVVSPRSIDSIKLDIPRYENGNPEYAYISASKAASQLHLDSLELGYDSIQIRIWYGFSKATSGQIFILRKNNIKWSAESIVIRYIRNPETLSSELSDTMTRVTYNKDLTSFSKKIFDLKITSLNDMKDIPGYKDEGEADGNGCVVEIATKNNYRFFGYWEPSQYKNKYWQANNMVEIIELLEREFNFKPLAPL